MKKHDIVNIAKQLLVIMLLVFVGCTKDIQPEQKTPKITETTVESQTTRVFFSWEVDYPGMVSSLVKVSLNQDMTDAVSFGDDASVEGGHFSAAATNLKKATTYYYCFTVTNPGLAYQSEVNSVTTLTDTPEVKTVEVSVTGQNSATVSCEVIDDCGASVTERGVYYSTNPLPNAFQKKVASGNGLGTYSVSLSDLFAGKTYYVCAYAVNANGTACGEELTFTTEPGLPSVTTNEVTEITWTSAIGGGTIQSDGGSGITEKGLCWSTSHNPDISGTHTNAGAGLGSFSVEMTGLTLGTTYYVRAYAKNSKGVSYGEEKTFTTNALQKPMVSTVEITGVTSSTATVSAEVTSDGGDSVTERGIYYGTSPNPASTGTKLTAASAGTGSFTCTITGLDGNSTYYVCAFATNSLGTSYGNVSSFTSALAGAINGVFSVSATTQVYFSQGNLQYIGSAAVPYWKFADHQWDYLGGNGQGSTNVNVDRDLFGWGTSGYNHGAVCYQPWSTSTNYEDYYAYGSNNYNLYDQSGKADWGYNAISNGGNQENRGWRTLTKEEWVYVFNTRSTSSGARFAKACVNGVNGMILLPDNWNSSTYSLSSTNNGKVSYNTNVISASQWSTLENAGAVFLPAAGVRTGIDVSSNLYGNYWSSQQWGICGAFHVCFEESLFAPDYTMADFNHGLSVRLVCPVQ